MSDPPGGMRARRVSTAVRERLSRQLIEEVGDPVLAGVVIAEVELPDDLSVAHIKVRLLVGGEDPARRQAAMRALGRATNRLRRGLGRGLALKRVPELAFAYDTGADAAHRVEELLGEIAEERGPSGRRQRERGPRRG